MVPSECALLEGMTWQFTQASAFDSAGAVAPWFTCARCTPATPVADATTGGATAWFTSAPATLVAARRAVARGAGHVGEVDRAVDVPGRVDDRLGGVAVVAVAVAAGGERRAGRVRPARRRAVAGVAGDGAGVPVDGVRARAVLEVAVAVGVGAGAARVRRRDRARPGERAEGDVGQRRWRAAGWPGWRRCGTRCRPPASRSWGLRRRR